MTLSGIAVQRTPGTILLAAMVLASAIACSPAVARGSVHLGPLLETGPDVFSGGTRLDALGPLIHATTEGDAKELGFLPLWYQSSRPRLNVLTADALYPLFSYRRYGEERRFSFVELATWETQKDEAEKTERSTTIFPFYLRKHQSDGRSDLGLFPFYGKLINRFGRDEIRFVMFPFYAKTWKKDLVTTNIVYPFVSWWRAPDRTGFQVLPFYGRDVAPGRFRKVFVLWPGIFKQSVDLDTDAPQEILLVLPFYASFESANVHSRTILWPFFTHAIDRKRQTEEWDLPFPFVVFLNGPERRITRVLPFYGREDDHGDVSTSILWPVYKRQVSEDETTFSSRTRILFYLIQNKRSGSREGPAYDRRVDVWPLGTYIRQGADGKRVWALSLLEPLFPENEKVQKIYAPFWRLFDYNRRDKTHYRISALWNLFRMDRGDEGSLFSVAPLIAKETGPESVEWSFLMGMFQWRHESGGSSLRLFYLPWPLRWGSPEATTE